MPLVVSDDEVASILESVVAGGALTLRLYTNDHDPSRGDAPSSYDEADFDGYAPAALPSWSIVEGQTPVAEHPEVTFRSAASQLPQEVYGYYITRQSGRLAWAERFPDGPYTVRARGDAIRVAPRIAGRED